MTEAVKSTNAATAADGNRNSGNTNQKKNKPVYSPPAEIRETATAFVVRCDVPGADEKSVQVTLEDGVLTIEAESTVQVPPNSKLLLAEFEPATYRRTFTVRRGVDVNGIVARVKHGVLTVELRKLPENQPVKITVQSGD